MLNDVYSFETVGSRVSERMLPWICYWRSRREVSHPHEQSESESESEISSMNIDLFRPNAGDSMTPGLGGRKQ